MTHPWPTMLLGLIGVLAGLALPFAPTWVQTSTVTWPVPGQAVTSSSAAIVPYRPTTLTATVPCSALRAAGPDRTVLETGTGPGTLDVTGARVRVDGRTVPLAPSAAADCRAAVTAGPGGVTVESPDGRRTELTGQPVPQVFGFRTDLGPRAAAGLSVTVEVTDPFATTPGALKIALVAAQLGASAAVVVLLPRVRRRRPRHRPRWRRVWWVDAAVVTTLLGWAVIGPLAVDDGWASMIARNVAATGSPGNYYRWWNAPEVPFAFSQELLAPLTSVSIAPLWLRLPSTLLAVATWYALSRGVLGALLPVRAATIRVRVIAALCLLAAWLPFNLGTRPESFVALGVTAAFALSLRVRDPRGLGVLALVLAVTVPVSPSGVIVAAPILVCAPRLLAILRGGARTRLIATASALSCLLAVALTIVFADQTWDGLLIASDWHTFFGPALPWWDEPDRYRYLLGGDQQGSAAKRLPILLAAAMIPVVGLLALPRRRRDVVGRAALRTAAVFGVALALFAVSPSKWSYHLGAVAGPAAALLTVGVVLVARRARTPDRYTNVVAAAGTALLIAAAAVSFDGPNSWWLPVVYDVPWEAEPPRPLGLSLNSPLPWLVAVAAVTASGRRLARAPAVTTMIAVGAALALLLGSFAAAPLRRSEGSLATVNLNRLTGGGVCGLADDVEVLPDGPTLAASADGGEQLTGFAPGAGYPPAAPPPDPPGRGASTYLWGSLTPGTESTGRATSPWFVLPPQPANGGVTTSVAGRTDGGNRLAFEFGRAGGDGVTPLGEIVPADRPAAGEDPAHPLWRSLGVDATAVPAGADRVRIDAVDARTDPLGWLAFTGPRLRSVIGLTAFLADKGPVLVGWPVAFLFPCIHDVPWVRAGVASTPLTVIESPRPSLIEDRRRDVGGVFATLTVLGQLHEVPSRLVGRPDVDWGSVQVFGGLARDAYRRTVTRELVPGIGGVAHPAPER
ncbi:arabinosyltransferase domain-containing protein [Mycobacterium yunnanensis]|uniref:Arabinosyltransferase domain-containing protein n=1 Tax=Mycobacterium yunnanensis TaxID=368477 RepID=A0A9X2YZN3_9MYCO|nr:arabinosyltransferase domain-containing protein [Mycobacterium yunnanensis]MCV7421248.1 arabinosyltransferase domain-containing protein [Mycobacterium yunnanensis]